MNDEAEVIDVPSTNGQAPSMTVEQAFANVSEVCAAFSGNLAQHQMLQESLRAIALKLEGP